MKFAVFFQRMWRKSELRIPNPRSLLRKFIWTLRGAKIGDGTRLPRSRVVWPHQVKIGAHCTLQHDIFFNYDHFWTPGPSILIGDRVFVGAGVEFNCQGRIEIGNDSLIAAGCRFVDHDHASRPDKPIREQGNVIQPIVLEAGVWLGANVVVLKGVTIGSGAVIGAGSVVTRSVPPLEVWGGVPAKLIHSRSRE